MSTLSVYASSLSRWIALKATNFSLFITVVIATHWSTFQRTVTSRICAGQHATSNPANTSFSALLQPHPRSFMWIYRSQEGALHLLEDFVEILMLLLQELLIKEDC